MLIMPTWLHQARLGSHIANRCDENRTAKYRIEVSSQVVNVAQNILAQWPRFMEWSSLCRCQLFKVSASSMSSGQNTEVCLQAKVSGHQEKKRKKTNESRGRLTLEYWHPRVWLTQKTVFGIRCWSPLKSLAEDSVLCCKCVILTF